MKIYFLTGNQGKFKEAQALLSDLEQLDIDVPEIQETDARKVLDAKLQAARARQSGSFVVEDTSLYFDCLNGLPGPFIKWFLKRIGNEGLVRLTEALGDNRAEAKAIVGYIDEQGEEHFFEGVLRGTIVTPRGEGGFGFDPIFQPEGYDRTLGEMSLEDKNEISMRRKAFEQLRDFLDQKT
jgi:non-canonical purine NTP pyrophosphatase (RdgB/HAM1 family)